MIDLALFCLIISTLLTAVRIAVTSIGLKMEPDNEECPDGKEDVKWNKVGLAVCNYGSLALNIVAMVLIIMIIAA